MTRTNESSDMKLEITGRHLKVTPALRTFAREKLEKIRRLVDGSLEIHVILTVEKHRHAAEILVHGRHLGLSASEVTQDMYTSIGECVDKLETQARRHKEKHTTRRRRAAALSEAPEDLPAPEKARTSRTPSAPPAARRRKATDDADEDGLQIVRTPMPRPNPMSVAEAAVQVMETDLGFIVFRNDRSRSINILYRRKDGRFGLIEPEG